MALTHEPVYGQLGHTMERVGRCGNCHQTRHIHAECYREATETEPMRYVYHCSLCGEIGGGVPSGDWEAAA